VPVRHVYEELGLAHARGPVLLRQGLVQRLLEARARLGDGFDLVVLDGWRSLDLQRELVAHYSAGGAQTDGYVADPAGHEDPPHTTGGAVDLTLTWQGAGLALGTDYDDFTERARPDSLEQTEPGSTDAALRRLLAQVLSASGLAVHPLEWWHWSYGDAVWSAQTGAPVCYALTGTQDAGAEPRDQTGARVSRTGAGSGPSRAVSPR